jgi:preprotein translocase subunit SecA
MSRVGVGAGRALAPERAAPALSTLDAWGERLTVAVRDALGGPLREARRALAEAEGTLPALRDALPGEAVAAARAELRGSVAGAAARGRGIVLAAELVRRATGARPDGETRLAALLALGGRVAEAPGADAGLAATLAACVGAWAGWPVHVLAPDTPRAQALADDARQNLAQAGLGFASVSEETEANERHRAYTADIVFGAARVVALDYLRDRVTFPERASPLRARIAALAARPGRRPPVRRGLGLGLVVDAERVLLEDATRALTVSGEARDAAELEVHREAMELARRIEPGRHVALEGGTVTWLAEGREYLALQARAAGGAFSGPRRREELVGEALVALHVLERGRHYGVEGGRILPGAELVSGGLSPGRAQLLALREGLEPEARRKVLASLSMARFLRRYHRLGGLATAVRELAPELWSTYGLGGTRVATEGARRRPAARERVFDSTAACEGAVAEGALRARGEGRRVVVLSVDPSRLEPIAASLGALGCASVVLLPSQVAPAPADDNAVVVAPASAALAAGQPLASWWTGGAHVIRVGRTGSSSLDLRILAAGGGARVTAEGVSSLEAELFVSQKDWLGRLLAWLAACSKPSLANRLRAAAMDRAARCVSRARGRARRQTLDAERRRSSMLGFSGGGP